MLELNNLYNMDCMEGMKQFPENYFELAIVDPPYFSGPDKLGYYGAEVSGSKVKRQKYSVIGEWQVPTQEYYEELLRVSKNQIIWGINYYQFQNVPVGRIVWDKNKNPSCTFSDGEIASCSLIETVKFFRYTWDGFIQQDMKNKEVKTHPTQKPVALYKWILMNYAKQGDKILDTNVGSASSLLACYDMGFEYIGFELDKDYFDLAQRRIADNKAQVRFEL
jgi:site-specific DNA-methyltransferase (adenine-specific)